MLTHQHHTIEEADEDRMSTQDETTTDEDEKKRKRPTVKSFLGMWPLAAKLLEMCICILCIVLVIEPIRISSVGTRYTYQLLLIFTTYGGFLVTLGIFFLGRLFGDRLPFKTNAMFSIVASFLNLATGCLILVDRLEFSRKYIFAPNMFMLDRMCASGVLAIVNMFVFAIDAGFTLKLQSDM